jgi:hypothetical protein
LALTCTGTWTSSFFFLQLEVSKLWLCEKEAP